MMDQNRLEKILSRMRSDDIPEHTAAADEFMQEGYPTSVLFAEIEKTQQPNLVSMYFYISGKRSDEEASQAWRYLRKRIETAPDQFVSRTYNPMELSPENRYLLFSARKYLITNKNSLAFLSHLEDVKKEAELCIKNILSTLDVTKDSFIINGENPGDYNTMMSAYVRYAIKREFPQFEGLGEENNNLTPEELHLASQITSLDIYNDCCRIQKVGTIPLLFYRQWLIYFFFDAVKNQVLERSLRQNKEENLIRYIGFNTSEIQSILAQDNVPNTPRAIDKCDEISRRIYSSLREKNWGDLKQAFKEFFVLVETYEAERFSNDNSIANPSEVHIMLAPIYRLTWQSYNSLECGNSLAILKHVLICCDNQEFCFDILSRVEDVVYKCLEGRTASFLTALVSLNVYFYFEQKVCDIGHSTNFAEDIFKSLNMTEIRQYCEPILLPYIGESRFESDVRKERQNASMALDVLLPSVSLKAYAIVRGYLLKNGEQMRHLEQAYYSINPCWTAWLQEFYESLYKKSNYARKHVFSIGLLWEQLCQDICKQYYQDVLTNHDGVRFENNAIPDIVVGDVEQNNAGIILHAEKVVECKKSLYFAISPKLQDEAIEKYLDYCETLEYWILEKPASYESPRNSKVKYIFAEDMLGSSWLDDERKKQIQILMDDNKNGTRNMPTPQAVKEEDIFALINRIDTLLENVEITTAEQMTQTTYKSNFVIRQYDLSGTFIKEYSSVFAASRAVGLKVDAITVVTSGRRNSAGGFLWKKCPIGSPVENIEPPNTALQLEGKMIFQVDQYGEVIATYDTINQAVRMTGISRRSISDALKGIQKTAGGFIWTLAEIPNQA